LIPAISAPPYVAKSAPQALIHIQQNGVNPKQLDDQTDLIFSGGVLSAGHLKFESRDPSTRPVPAREDYGTSRSAASENINDINELI